LFDSGATTSRLDELAESLPSIAAARSWADDTHLPLTPSAALSLGRFDTLFIELVGQCNERCVHCYASSSPEIRAKLEHREVESILADAAALGFTRVQFTGG